MYYGFTQRECKHTSRRSQLVRIDGSEIMTCDNRSRQADGPPVISSALFVHHCSFPNDLLLRALGNFNAWCRDHQYTDRHDRHVANRRGNVLLRTGTYKKNVEKKSSMVLVTANVKGATQIKNRANRIKHCLKQAASGTLSFGGLA